MRRLQRGRCLSETSPALSSSSKPHGTDLSGISALLPNVAWTDEGAIDLDELPERQLTARLSEKVLEVSSVDKFPKMTNYVVPAA